MNSQRLVMLCITSLLLLIPISSAAYDVVSNISSNSTEYTTSAIYGELHNISLATGTGTTFLAASWDARVNFTAPLYGRFMRDGVSFGRFNLTQNVYATVGSYQVSFEESAGTHYYGWEVYSNKKGTIYNRNFSAFFLVNGSFSAASYNSTYDAYQALITALQNNDTVDRVYVNNTFLPITTYSGNFPNTTLASKEATWDAKLAAESDPLWAANYTGAYAKDTSNGTPALDADGNLLVLGNTITVNRDGVDEVYIRERTSYEQIIRFYRAASNDFIGSIMEKGIWRAINTNNASTINRGTLADARMASAGTWNGTTTTVNNNLANWNATYNSSYAYGGFDVLFSNGTNVLAVGTKAHVKAKYAGTLTDLTAHSVETGSINISAYNLTLGTYIGSAVITAGTDGSTTGLSYTFAKGDWLNLTVSSVTDIKQVTAAVQTVKS